MNQQSIRQARPISWVKAARKEFDKFPMQAQETCSSALVLAAEGEKSDIAKPMRGFGSGVFEIALPYRGDAFRVVYAVLIADAIWVVHAFQKKSTQGIKTPKREVELIEDRIRRLREDLNERRTL